MILEPANAAEWAALITIASTLLVATVSGGWAVWVRSQENTRAEWRRIEELVQIVYNGASKGLWAQKLAVDELVSLKRRRDEILPILREASNYFRSIDSPGVSLADHIDSRLAG